MKTLFKILLTSFFCLFIACSPLGNPVDVEKSDSHYYNSSKSSIQYSPMGNWFELGNTEMSADIASFEVFNSWLSRDKDYIFFDAYKVETSKIDLATFVASNKVYMKDIGYDKDYVYAFGKEIKDKKYYGTFTIIEEANSKTFIRTHWDWAHDGKYHYYLNKKVDAHYDSFKTINQFFAIDQNQTYVRKDKTFKPFLGDVASLQTLEGSSHMLDHENIYWLQFFTENSNELIPIPYVNENEIELLNHYFLKIKDTIYFDGLAQQHIDAKSFEIIDHSYAKDAAQVYYKSQIVIDADVNSFKRMENSYKYMDKNGVYIEGKLEKEQPEGRK